MTTTIKASTRSCQHCEHGVFRDGYTESFVRERHTNHIYVPVCVVCKWMPTEVRKSPDDWCGQFKAKEVAE